MSEKVTVSWRVPPEKKDLIMELVNNYSDEKHLDKGEGLYKLLKNGIDKLTETTGQDYSRVKPHDCNFLMYDKEADTWVCLETIARNKKAQELGMDGIKVKQLCTACFDKRTLERKEAEYKLIQRKGFDRLAQFYKQFQIITENGLKASVKICTCENEDGGISISRNGHTLNCGLNKREVVSIDDICLKRLDEVTNQVGCPWLISIDSIVDLKDTETYKDLVKGFPELEHQKEE